MSHPIDYTDVGDFLRRGRQLQRDAVALADDMQRFDWPGDHELVVSNDLPARLRTGAALLGQQLDVLHAYVKGNFGLAAELMRAAPVDHHAGTIG